VHGTAAGAPFVLSVPSSMHDLGTRAIHLGVPTNRVHLFDKASGHALRA